MRLHVGTQTPKYIPSVYFSAGYGRASALQLTGEWITVANDEGSWQMPLVVTSDDNGNLDASTPYGYGGIYAASGLGQEEVRRAWVQALSLLRERKVTSLFLRFSPFLQTNYEVLSGLPSLDLEPVSETVVVPCHDYDSIWAGLKGNARTAVRKARAAGLKSKVTSQIGEISDSSHPFRVLYSTTMNRLNARDQYHFKDEYFEALVNQTPKNWRLVSVENRTGATVAASLVLVDGDIAHYHLSGSDPDYARQGANNLLITTILEWASSSKIREVHLGGGTKQGDSLFKFKRSFGGYIKPFVVGRAIVDEPRFIHRLSNQAQLLGCTPSELTATGYFPPYKAEL